MDLKTDYRSGFTLIEVLVAISISLLIISVSFSVFSSFNRDRAMDVGRENIVSMLKIARSNTLASKDDDVYGIHFASSTVTLFKGSNYVSSDSNNIVHTFPRFIEISVIDLIGGGSDVIFNRLTGETNQYGTTTLRLISNPTVTIDITIKNTGLSEF